MSAYDSIKQGLNEALAFAQGKPGGARVQLVEMPRLLEAAKPRPRF